MKQLPQKKAQMDKKVGKDIEKGKKKPKKVTAAYLERAALHYLGRFSSSEKNLRDVLIRKIRRRNESFAPPTDEQTAWIDDVVKKCVRYSYVDDQAYAKQRAELLLRRGKPLRLIAQDLRHKGVGAEDTEAALSALSGNAEVDADKRAAAAYIKRRRFGPFRRPIDDPERLREKTEKEMASMARAGFGYDLSRDLLKLETEELMDLLV